MEIEQAKQAIEQDKKGRVYKTIKGLDELLKQNNCILQIKYKFISEDQPSIAEVGVVAL